MHTPKVLAAALLTSPEDTEAQFYEALQAADLERLMSLWADEDEIACVHPGGPRMIGPEAVRAGFEALLAQGPVAAHPEQVRRMQSGDTAIHHVLERVQVTGPQGPQSAWVLATNVYLKTALGWRMVLHHASPGTPGDSQPMAAEPTTLH